MPRAPDDDVELRTLSDDSAARSARFSLSGLWSSLSGSARSPLLGADGGGEGAGQCAQLRGCCARLAPSNGWPCAAGELPCRTRGGPRSTKWKWGCCALTALLVLIVYAICVGVALLNIYAAMNKTGASIIPLEIGDLCGTEVPVTGQVEFDNPSWLGFAVKVKSVTVSKPESSSPAFSVRAQDDNHKMIFGGSGTSTPPPQATMLVTIHDPAQTGQLMQEYVVDMVVTMDVKVTATGYVGPFRWTLEDHQMVSPISPSSTDCPCLPYYRYSSEYVSTIPGCSKASPVKDKGVNHVAVLRNDRDAVTFEVTGAVSWYSPVGPPIRSVEKWRFNANIPATEWRLKNKLTRNPIGIVAVPSFPVSKHMTELTVKTNVSVDATWAVSSPRPQMHALPTGAFCDHGVDCRAQDFAGDAFKRSMDLDLLEVDIVGAGTAACPQVAKVLQHFAYPVVDWDSQANATYRSDILNNVPACYACRPEETEPYLDALVEISSVDITHTNGTHAELEVTIGADIETGVYNTGTTGVLSMLSASTLPQMHVTLHNSTDRQSPVVAEAVATYHGCVSSSPDWRPSTGGTKTDWCTKTRATVVIEQGGVGRVGGRMVGDLYNSEMTSLFMRVSEVAPYRSSVASSGESTVLARVLNWYPANCSQDWKNQAVPAGQRSRYSGIEGAYVGGSRVEGRIEGSVPYRYLQPTRLYKRTCILPSMRPSGESCDVGTQNRLYDASMFIKAGRVAVDIMCEEEQVGSLNATVVPAAHWERDDQPTFPVNASFDISTSLATPCFGAKLPPGAPLPPLRFMVKITPPDTPTSFVFESLTVFENMSGPGFNYSQGFKAESVCDNPVHFTLGTPAPSFMTVFGDVDITAAYGGVHFDKRIAANINPEKDAQSGRDSGPHARIRGCHGDNPQCMLHFDFNAYVDDPSVAGMMLDTWYSTWGWLFFDLYGKVRITSAPGNERGDFEHELVLAQNFSLPNTATTVIFDMMSLEVATSTNDEFTAHLDLKFDETVSNDEGYGFPPFDITVPAVYINANTYHPEGGDSFDFPLGKLTTSAFEGHGGWDAESRIPYLGKIEFTGELLNFNDGRIERWIKALVNYSLCSGDLPDENRASSVYLTADPHQNTDCLFQQALQQLQFNFLGDPGPSCGERYIEYPGGHYGGIGPADVDYGTWTDSSGPVDPAWPSGTLLAGEEKPSACWTNATPHMSWSATIPNTQILQPQNGGYGPSGGSSVHIHSLQLRTSSRALAGGDSDESLDVVLVLGEQTDRSIRNLMAGVPPMVLSLNAELGNAPVGRLDARLSFAGKDGGGTSGTAGLSTSQIGHMLNTLVEETMMPKADSVSGALSVDLAPALPSGEPDMEHQGMLLRVLQAAADAVNSAIASGCLLGGGLVGAPSAVASPVSVQVKTTASTLTVSIRVNVTAAAPASLSEYLAVLRNSKLEFGELGLDLFRAGADGLAAGSPVVSVRALPGSLEELALEATVKASAADVASSLVTDFLLKPQIGLVAQVVVQGSEEAAATPAPRRLSTAPPPPSLAIDIDVPVQGLLDCDDDDSGGGGNSATCPPPAGWHFSGTAVGENLCMYIGVGSISQPLAILATVKVPNPMPFPVTLKSAQVKLNAHTTDSSGNPTPIGSIATLQLEKAVLIAANTTTVVEVPVAQYHHLTSLPALGLAFERNEATFSIAKGSNGVASFKGGDLVDGVWREHGDVPFEFEVKLEDDYAALPSKEDCASVGKHFAPAACSPVLVTCSATGCGACGWKCGCAHSQGSGGRGTPCTCDPGFCADTKNAVCVRNLGPPPPICYGNVTGGSCRYEPCGSWRGGSDSVECSSAKRCVCKPGHCHDGKGRCVAIPAEAA